MNDKKLKTYVAYVCKWAEEISPYELEINNSKFYIQSNSKTQATENFRNYFEVLDSDKLGNLDSILSNINAVEFSGEIDKEKYTLVPKVSNEDFIIY